jgi:sugar phosphate permease
MKGSIPLIVAMSISGLLFMSISIRYKWSKKVWLVLNKKINPRYNVTVWILFSAIFNISLQLLCEIIGISFSAILMGISLGFYFAFLPSLDKGKQD